MSHRHKHAHCAHAHLGHCAICQVVYCHDCDQEWTPRATWWGTTYTYGNTTTIPGAVQLGYKSMTNAECPAQMTTTGAQAHRHGG